jgi:hypothetical protein
VAGDNLGLLNCYCSVIIRIKESWKVKCLGHIACKSETSRRTNFSW